MDQDDFSHQLRSWLTRSLPSGSVRVVNELPIAIASDVGLERKENQDKVILLKAQVTPLKFFIVGVLCDGMGGMVDGAACASLAISTFVSSCIRNRSLDVKGRVLNAVIDANKSVFNEYKGNGGATLSAFILDSDGNSAAVNVGDSRIYAVEGSTIKQISTDDTLAGQLKREVEGSPMNNKLLQFVGIGDELEVHQLELPDLKNISKLVLTSDGVHYINKSTFDSLLSQQITSLELSKRLINVAKWCGGHDNATSMVISDLYSLTSSSRSALTGTVQLWDHCGDVYFIGIANRQVTDPVRKSASHEVKEVTPEIDMKNGSSDDHKNIESDKDGKTRSRRGKKRADSTKKDKTQSQSEKIDEPQEVPQLRIDFDE